MKNSEYDTTVPALVGRLNGNMGDIGGSSSMQKW